MARGVLEQLLVEIAGTTAGLREELRKGGRDVESFAKRTDGQLAGINKSFATLGRGVRTALAAFGVSIGVAGIAAATRHAIDYADSLKDAGDAADFSVERLQRLRYVFEQNGLAQTETDMSLQRLNRRLGLFVQSGGGPAVQAFKDLGLATDITSGKLRGAERVFDAVVDKLSKVKDANLQAALASQIFGEDQGPKLLQTLRLGSEALKEAEAGLKNVIGPEQVSKADALNDSFTRLASNLKNDVYNALIKAGGGLADFFNVPEYENRGTLDQQLERALRERRDAQDRIARARRTLAGLPEGTPQARVAQVELNRALEDEVRLRERLEEILKRKAEARAAEETQQAAATQRRANLESLRVTGPGRRRDVQLASIDEAVAARRQALEEGPIRQLQDQVLQAQGRMSDVIKRQADEQIAAWQLVAKKTPEFADQAAQAIELINERTVAQLQALQRGPLQEFADQFSATFESRGIEALTSGKIRDAIRGLGQDLLELVLRLTVIKPLAESIAGSLSGLGGGGGLGAFFGSLFGGGKAAGGPVSPSRAYLVGEQGPELFMPNIAGRIMNTAQTRMLATSGGPTIVQHFHVQAGLPPQWRAQLEGVAGVAAAAADEAVSRRQRGQR